jgi:hypothetical protein
MGGNVSRLGNIFEDVAVKAPCRAATIGSNITLAGLQTIDGIALAAGDRVLVKDQSDQTANGIWQASSSSWIRTADASKNTDFVQGTRVLVVSGTVNQATDFFVTTTDNPIVIGTSHIVFVALPAYLTSQIPNSMLANMAQATVKGRASGAGTGSPQDLTGTQVKAIIGAIANADMATMAQATVKGRVSGAGTGTPTDLAASDLLTILGLSAPVLQRFVQPADFAAKSSPNRSDISPRSISGAGLGSVVMSATPSDVWRSIVLQQGLSDTYAYVDPINGNDGNPGTQASPYKTLNYALNTSTATNVVGIPTGPFDPCTFDGTSAAAQIKRLSFLGAAIIRPSGAGFPTPASLTWTVTSGAVYHASLSAMGGSSAPQRFIFLDTFETGTGLNARLPQYTNLAALQAASNASPTTVSGWAYDGGTKTIYVAFANNNVNTFKSKFDILYLGTSGDTTIELFSGVTLFIDAEYGLDLYGVSLQAYNHLTSVPTFLVEGRRKVRIFAANGNGVHTAGGFHYFSGIDVDIPQFDCFNHDPSDTGTESMIIIHDCQGNYGGDTATFGTGIAQNCNGRSIHGGANAICCGNLFIGNFGPNIADTVLPGYTNLSWSVGEITVLNSGTAQAGMGYFGTPGQPTALRKVWVDSGQTWDEPVSLYAQETTITLKQTNGLYNVPPTTADSAVIGSYSRNSP